ncbi:MAG TPA: metallophosphoesterase family protein [Vicinamibacterales bacterium]|nr:metallophosphoesterase family protein [Vicinamibacterales bacterium]
MRYLILSDIHANLDALEAVLHDAGDAWDRPLVLGDLAGYGADPNGVIDRVRALDPLAIIRGNHDKAACGLDDRSQFNQVARTAAEWTAGQLTPANCDYLRALPAGPIVVDETVEICHGAPFDEDHYIFDGLDAQRAIEMLTRPVGLFGHTHLPVVFTLAKRELAATIPEDGREPIALAGGVTYLVNPGSVGQPRDGDPRAAYGVLDTGARVLELRRVAYPIEQAQRKIQAAGLPPVLANRLALGR